VANDAVMGEDRVVDHVIRMPMGTDHREILDAVGRGHVVLDPLALAGDAHGVDDDGASALVDDVIARRDYRTEYNRENTRVLAESSRGRHGTR
jgi:streptomycin 6-kinase